MGAGARSVFLERERGGGYFDLVREYPIGTPRGLHLNTGPMASAAWLAERELYPREPKWHVVATLAAANAPATRFHIEIFAEEWGFRFEHAQRESWIRITDVPFVHGRDDHGLLARTPPLRRIGTLLRALETAHALQFDRPRAQLATTLASAESAIREWLATL